MKLTILGCYSATPRLNTNPTAQILHIKKHLFLIDCGEGTQLQLRKHKIKFNQIKHIFISHLHGDHFFGLAGLVSTFRLMTRKTALHIYGPKGIKEAITLLLKLGDSWTNYPLIFHELTDSKSTIIFEDNTLTVSTIPLNHRIYTNGFLFKEKPGNRKLNLTAAENAGINKAYYRKLQQGFDVENEAGITIENHTVTHPPIPPKSYAFCSDTTYFEDIIPIIQHANVLYHEATFLEQHKKLAESTKHSTAKQAAKIAEKAQVKTLILGHYSTRYATLIDFKNEAETIFKNVLLADDGKTFSF